MEQGDRSNKVVTGEFEILQPESALLPIITFNGFRKVKAHDCSNVLESSTVKIMSRSAKWSHYYGPTD